MKASELELFRGYGNVFNTYAPMYGSWLNMAEIELSALVRQCLNRRIPDEDALNTEAQAWAKQRNDLVVKVDWRFTTADARLFTKALCSTGSKACH